MNVKENSSLPSRLEDKLSLPQFYWPLQRCPADRTWHHVAIRQGLPVVCGIAWVWWWDGEETSEIPGQLTSSLQLDTLALIVHITQNNSVEGETCDCRLPPRSRWELCSSGLLRSEYRQFLSYVSRNYLFLLQGVIELLTTSQFSKVFQVKFRCWWVW
jgi:hypothetical protein